MDKSQFVSFLLGVTATVATVGGAFALNKLNEQQQKNSTAQQTKRVQVQKKDNEKHQQQSATTAAAPAVQSTSATNISSGGQAPPAAATSAVLVPGNELPEGEYVVKGYEFQFGKKVNWDELMDSYLTTGYQGTHLGKAILEVERMRSWRLSDEPLGEDEEDSEDRKDRKCKIFLGYTSNLISSGLREVFCFLAKNRMVDVIVSSAGGIEEDFIKCLAPTYTGEFHLRGADLRKKGLNRIGNLLVPNSNYCKFEDWLNPILDQMLKEQKEQGVVWTPSKMIHRLGKEINDERSVY
jgi:deoxyhypusine synthase